MRNYRSPHLTVSLSPDRELEQFGLPYARAARVLIHGNCPPSSVDWEIILQVALGF